MIFIRTVAQIAGIVVLVVLAVSVIPWLPFSLNHLQLWLVIPLVVASANPRLGLVLSIILGWCVDLYSPTMPGLQIVVLPATCALVIYFTDSWKIHRSWLALTRNLILGTFLGSILTIGYSFIFTRFSLTQGEATRLIDALAIVPTALVWNAGFGLIFSRFILRVFTNPRPNQIYGST